MLNNYEMKAKLTKSKGESNMYIPEFWAGVIVTIMAEVIALMVLAIINGVRK